MHFLLLLLLSDISSDVFLQGQNACGISIYDLLQNDGVSVFLQYYLFVYLLLWLLFCFTPVVFLFILFLTKRFVLELQL